MAENIKYDILETIDGSYKTTFNRTYKMRKPWKAANPKHILAAMPGMVVEMKVKPGDKVSKGDCLMLFKAMKMNNNVLSPMDGTIKAIDVKLNENMPKGTLLLEFE